MLAFERNRKPANYFQIIFLDKAFLFIDINKQECFRIKMINKNDLIGQIREKGLKITPQRLAVIDALVENRHKHPGVALIYQETRKKLKSISLSTVYATLKEFSEQGLIKALEFDRIENRYDDNLSEHINLICKRCGAISDFDLPSSIESKDIMRKSGFVVTDTRMEYYGYCRDCLKKP